MSLPTAVGLEGRRIGVSVSPSADLGRIGLADGAVEAVLGPLAEGLLGAGATLGYGGRIGPGAFGEVLVGAARRRGGAEPVLRVYLAWSEHRGLERGALADLLDAGPEVEVRCLDADGRTVSDPLADGGPFEGDEGLVRRGLTAMRRAMAEDIDARLLLGGRRSGAAGVLPGLVEEALLALETGGPLYLAAGFGGVTADIAWALGVDPGAWLPVSADTDALVRLAEVRAAGLRNGLSEEENRQLAAARDADAIAGLVARGLGRLAS